MNAKQLGEQLAAKRTAFATLWESKPDRDFTDDEVKELEAINAELSDIGTKYSRALQLEKTAEDNARALQDARTPVNGLPTPQGKSREQREYKGFGSRLQERAADIRAFAEGNVKSVRLDLPDDVLIRDFGFKTLLTTADWDIPVQYLNMTVESVQLPIIVSDLMLQGRAEGPQLRYMEETTFTNNAAETAEGGTKPESALDFTARTDDIRKIPTWIPLTDEVLEDIPQMESYVRQRLAFMVTQRRESQLINGNGTSPNISGILDRTGIGTQALGGDPAPDAIYKAMQKVRVEGDAEPTAALIHPNNWTPIRLLRDGATYVFGAPTVGGTEQIFGLTVRQTTAMTAGTALVGAFRPHAQFFRRSGITIELSRDHSTYRVENKVLIIAEERVGLAVFRPTAFVQVTGLTS